MKLPTGSLSRLLVWTLALALPAAALVACGGGGGDPMPPLPPLTRTVILSGAQETALVASPASGSGTLTVDQTTRMVSGSISFVGVTSPSAAHIHTAVLGSDGPVLIGLTLAGNTATVPAGTVLTEAQYFDFLNGRLYFNVHSPANPAGELRGQIGVETHSARLDPAQELNPAIISSALGSGLVIVDSSSRAISGGIKFSGMSASAAHIHTGAAGVNGPVAIGLTLVAGIGTIPAGTVLTETQFADLQAGNLYFNVHSAAYPGGEIRGQIGRVVRVATLSGASEVPPVTSAASGSAIVAVHPRSMALTGVASFSGLTASAAHIHTGAAGVNGPVTIGLTLVGNSASVPAGTVLTEAQFADLVNGLQYVNVHTSANPGGEIRGQLRP